MPPWKKDTAWKVAYSNLSSPPFEQGDHWRTNPLMPWCLAFLSSTRVALQSCLCLLGWFSSLFWNPRPQPSALCHARLRSSLKLVSSSYTLIWLLVLLGSPRFPSRSFFRLPHSSQSHQLPYLVDTQRVSGAISFLPGGTEVEAPVVAAGLYALGAPFWAFSYIPPFGGLRARKLPGPPTSPSARVAHVGILSIPGVLH